MKASLLAAAALAPATALANQCRYLPGDAYWPSPSAWAFLNATVGGRLIATTPIGSPCHSPNYDAAACATLQNAWTNPQTHYTSSSSVMQTYWANQSCDPFTPTSKPCLLGNYVSYAVNVSCVADVSAALLFAQLANIRVVVRNTGHDFFGRSTGAGSLAIWTHNLKSIDIKDWSDETYSGKAMRVGAGVQGFEAVAAASAQGLTVVTGECPSVGLAGGYTQGGGHSALSTTFGMAADQVLEYEVVTAFGMPIKASATNNSDLFWALRGGGGGTYAVVTAMTVRAHPDLPVGGGALTIYAAATTTDNFYAAVTALQGLLPQMIDQGASVGYLMTSQVLAIDPVTVYNSTGDYVKNTVLAPFTAKLAELGIAVTPTYTTLNYLDHYAAYMGPLPNGHLTVETYQFGSRLIPRSAITSDNGTALGSVLRNLTQQGLVAAGSAASYTSRFAGSSTAVLPQWRDTVVAMQIATLWNETAPWSQMLANQALMTNQYVPQLVDVAPTGATYLNEADFNTINWKSEFYGVNYDKFLAVKQKWDPLSIFYAFKGVGSDSWTVGNDGRMCRA